jgi:hypothetical protein
VKQIGRLPAGGPAAASIDSCYATPVVIVAPDILTAILRPLHDLVRESRAHSHAHAGCRACWVIHFSQGHVFESDTRPFEAVTDALDLGLRPIAEGRAERSDADTPA